MVRIFDKSYFSSDFFQPRPLCLEATQAAQNSAVLATHFLVGYLIASSLHQLFLTLSARVPSLKRYSIFPIQLFSFQMGLLATFRFSLFSASLVHFKALQILKLVLVQSGLAYLWSLLDKQSQRQMKWALLFCVPGVLLGVAPQNSFVRFQIGMYGVLGAYCGVTQTLLPQNEEVT
jgi:hypothetical protein